MMPVGDVKVGQTGQCLTVFEGSEIEPFEFVVKGVMNDYLGPARHLVLIRLVGEKPEFTGVVAGMSGSPCSIDGKLVGALGYGFATFAKEPIAGITPIDDMLAVTKLPLEQRPWRLPGGAKTQWEAFESGQAPVAVERQGESALAPIATPLSMSGVPPALQRHFGKWFEAMGFVPVAGGSGGGGSEGAETKVGQARPFEPGAPIAAVLVSGDVNVVATGTVTTVDGDQITAFGHPFMANGATSIPMAQATIVNTMATMSRSFKMASAGEVVGELTQDRLSAIAGLAGQFAATIPVTGTIRTPARTDSFRLELARDMAMSPYLLAMSVSSAISGRLDVGRRGTLRYDATINVEGAPSIKISDVASGEHNQMMMYGPGVVLGRTLASIWKTPFSEPPRVSVELDVRYDTTPLSEVIESVFVDRPLAAPGDNIHLAVRLKRPGGEIATERFVVKVPPSWAGSVVDFAAVDATFANRLQRGLGGNPRPETLPQLVKWLAGRRPGGHLYLLGVRNGVGMRAEVDVMSFIPPSVAAMVSGDQSKQLRFRGMAWEERSRRPGTVAGMATTRLRISRY